MAELIPWQRDESRRERLEAMTLEELLKEAESYGAVRVFSSRSDKPPNCYLVGIRFDTSPGTEVEAKSDHDLPISAAFIQAIERAQGIVASIAGLGGR